MFVRKKRNRSGSISVVVVSKQSRRYKEIYTIGTSTDPTTIEKYYKEGILWIQEKSGVSDMFIQKELEKYAQESINYFFNAIEHILLNGNQLILNQVFKLIGFDKIEDTIFRQIVISRICQPSSKKATVDYLKTHFDEDVRLYKIYEYLDKLHKKKKDKVEEISIAHTRKILGGKLGLVFYDVTTLYFETDLGDELRKPGYSKDGKHSLPQIVLGLLVSEGGYPLAYSIHEGNKYEGYTILPVVENFVQKFNLTDFVIIAYSGLMNKDNIDFWKPKIINTLSERE
jgi:transposase